MFTLENFNEEQKKALVNSLDCKIFSKDEIISKEGECEQFFAVQSGKVEIKDSIKNVTKNLQPGETFGEDLVSKEGVNVRGFTIRATQPTFVITLGKKKLMEIFGEKVLTLPLMNIHKEAFTRHAMLSKLTEIQIEKISELVTFKKMKKGEYIFKKEDKPTNVIVVIDGEVKEESSGHIHRTYHIFNEAIENSNEKYFTFELLSQLQRQFDC